MALTQTGENQRKIGVNLSKIIGLKDNAEKIQALNMDRQKGGYNAVYFNGRNAGTESGGTDPTCTPCGGGSGGGGSGGGGSGGGGSGGGGGGGDENCVEIALNTRPKDECVQGKDCETGASIGIHPTEPPIYECPNPPKPECFNGYVAVVYPYPYKQGVNDAQLASLDNIQGAFDAAAEKGLEYAKKDEEEQYGSGGTFDIIKINETQRSISSCGVSYNYMEYRLFYVYHIGGWDRTGSATASVVLTGLTQSTNYQQGLENFNKNKPRKYAIKNGKIVDMCGNALPVDCIEMCDSNGNKYKVCGNGSVSGIT